MPLFGADVYVPGRGDGLPGEFTLSGSGLAVPAGLEAVLEFNGIYLNARQNIDRYRITEIDGLADADIRDTRDPNTDDDGETPFNSFYGGRTIVLNGVIETYSVPKMRDMTQALRGAFSDLSRELPLVFRTGDFNRDHFINCKKIGSINIVESQTNFRASRPFQVSLRASNPRFLSFYQKSLLDVPPIPSTNRQIFVANNSGNYLAEPGFRIYGPSAKSTFVNDITGKSFTVLDVPGSDFFDFNIATKSFTNSTGVDQWNFLDDDSDFVRLVSGDNPIFYTGDSPRIEMYWHDSWM